jgi:hypothetical protein
MTDACEYRVGKGHAAGLLWPRKRIGIVAGTNEVVRTPRSADAVRRQDARAPWRAAGVGLTSLGTPIGIGLADPVLGQVALAIELFVVLAVIGTALFGSQDLSERAFRLLRWIANRSEPPGPGATSR